MGSELHGVSRPRFDCQSFTGALVPGGPVFVVQAGYHLDDALSLAAVLDRFGESVNVMVPTPPDDVLRRLRSTTWRHREIVDRGRSYGLDLDEQRYGVDEVAANASVVIVRNDWGESRQLLQTAHDRGVPTVGWAEGVQDFDDVDTGRLRRPYRTVDHVFCLGPYDVSQLRECSTFEVGSDRLWRAWRGDPTTATRALVANVNFTYRVRTDARRGWTRDVIMAAERARVPLSISRHPADRGWRGRRSEIGSLGVHLGETARLVTRFSTAVYEALVRGVDVVYYNPHGERVPTFSEPMGAFAYVRTRAELIDVLRTPAPDPVDVRRRAEPFLRHHLVLDEPAPGERAAAALRELLGRSRAAPRTAPPTPEIEWVVLTRGDRPRELDAALASIEAQEGVSASAVVVANGGAVDASTGRRARVVTLDENVGIPAGRDVGLRSCTGQIVGFLDDDARLDPGASKRILAAFDADPALAVVAIRIVDEHGDTQRRLVPRIGGDAETGGPVASFLGGANALRVAAYDDVGGYFDALEYGHEEIELSWRLADRGWGVRYLPDATAFHPRTPIGRHARGWELTGRNRVWIARRTLPWPIALIHVLVWLVVGWFRAPDAGCRRSYLRGWRHGWTGRIERSPISWRGVWRLTRLGRPPMV